MITDAVTPAAPAVANQVESKVERNAEFLPTSRHYRMTGEMPAPEADTEEASAASTKEKKTPPVNEGESATSNSDTAAASEAAKTAEEEKEAKPGKTAATSENRWQKITRENKELRDRLQRLETAPREDKQTSQPAAEAKTQTQTAPAANPKPKIDDVDSKTGKAKYATFAEYEDAKDAWLSDEAVRKFQETTAKATRETEQQQRVRTQVESFNKKFEAPRAKYPDFNEVALNPDLVIPMGSVTELFLQDSDHAGEVLYHLGQNPDILAAFHDKRSADEIKTGKYTNKITPQRQFRKLLEIEAKFAGSSAEAAQSGTHAAAASDKTSSARPVTQAPRPPHQVSGKGNAAKDAVEQAVEDSDQDTYMREQNARDLARRKKGK